MVEDTKMGSRDISVEGFDTETETETTGRMCGVMDGLVDDLW